MDESLYDIRRQEFSDLVNQRRMEAEDNRDEDIDPVPLESTPIPDTFTSVEDEETGVGEAAFDGDN